MGKFLAFILSPFKWIKCICHLIYLDFRYEDCEEGEEDYYAYPPEFFEIVEIED